MKILYTNAHIYTASSEQAAANCFLVEDGKFIWVGDQLEAPESADVKIDLKWRRVLPGMIDAHMHPLFLAKASVSIPCLPPLTHSIEELLMHIRKDIKTHPEFHWIEGWGYDEGKLKERRAPLKEDLDRASSDFPIVMTRTCGHIVSVNSKALEIAGITAETKDPVGGKIDRHANGEPTGILRENARDLVLAHIPKPSAQQLIDSLVYAGDLLASRGVTATTELLATQDPYDYYSLYQQAAQQGLRQKVTLAYSHDVLKMADVLTEQTTDRAQQIHIGGVKLFTDGSVSGRTAWVEAPYKESDDEFGIAMTTKEALLEGAAVAKEHGLQTIIHAMGEQAMQQVVDAYRDTENWLDDGPSIRIEHAAMPTQAVLTAAAKQQIAFVPQPIFLFAEVDSYVVNLGQEKMATTYPVKTMLDYGIPVAFSSDAPATSWGDAANPFVGIQAAVTRTSYDGTDCGQDQRVSVKQAIDLYTREAAKVTRIPFVGQIQSGFDADFIVLDQDIFSIPEDQISQIEVLQTYIRGELCYEKEGVSQL